MSHTLFGFADEMGKIADVKSRLAEVAIGAGVGAATGFAASKLSRRGYPVGMEEAAGATAGGAIGAAAGLTGGAIVQRAQIIKKLKAFAETKAVKTIASQLADTAYTSRPALLKAQAEALTAADAPFKQKGLSLWKRKKTEGIIGHYQKLLENFAQKNLELRRQSTAFPHMQATNSRVMRDLGFEQEGAKQKLDRATKLLNKLTQAEGGHKTRTEAWLKQEKDRLTGEAGRLSQEIEASTARHKQMLDQAREGITEDVRNRIFGIL
jgi:hypothetical protein